MSWPTVTLSEICKTQYGYTASAHDSVVGPKFLRITDIVKPSIEWDSVPYCKIDDANLNRYLLKNGDIVVARTGYPGHAKLIRHITKDAIFASYLVRITLDDAIANPQYVGRLLESSVYRGFVQSVKSGVAQAHANAKVLTLFRFQLPPMEVQSRIVNILANYDDLIETNRRRIQLLEQSARLLYKEWFVHLRFPGHQHVTLDNGVPRGWKICGMMKHPYFSFIHESLERYEGSKRYYATADISGIFITGEGIDYAFEKKPSRAQKLPEVGSVWFARMQETYKVLAFTKANRDVVEKSMLSSGFAGFRVRQPNIIPFLFLTVNNERFHEEKDRFCTGATQRSLTNSGLKNINTWAPAISIVNAFAESTAPAIDQILTLQAINKRLSSARDLLLPRLMSGELKV